MRVLRFIAVALAIWPGTARPDASTGEVFGYRLGTVVEGFDRSEIWSSFFSLPWVNRKPDNAAGEFNRLEVLVTPFSGTIVGVRAIADFEDLSEADKFADRLTNALTAKFGDSILYRESVAYPCPYTDPKYLCTSLPPDVDRYARRLSAYVMQVARYNNSGEHPAVYFTFAYDEDNPAGKPAFDRLNREYDAYKQWFLAKTLEQEKDHALRGIE